MKTHSVRLTGVAVLLPFSATLACIGDDTTDLPTDLTPGSVLQFEEAAEALGLELRYDFSSDFLEQLEAAPGSPEAQDAGRRDAGSAAGGPGLGDAGSASAPREVGVLPGEVSLYGGVAAADVDADGLTDILVLRGQKPGRLFRNLGGEFADITDEMKLELPEFASGPTFADFDGDGFVDLLVSHAATGELQLYKNLDGKRFEPAEGARLSSSVPVLGFVTADVDGDADLDLLALRSGAAFDDEEARTGLLFLNDGNAVFTDASAALQYPLSGESIESARGGAFTDIDADGDLDLLLVQDFAGTRAFENRGGQERPKFTPQSAPKGLDSARDQGLAVADYDNDGDWDWFVTSVTAEDAEDFRGLGGNRLLRNDGDGEFEDVADSAGVADGSWGTGACFADFNNDSLLDIFQVNGAGFNQPALVSKGREFFNDSARLFIQRVNSPGKFTELAAPAKIDDDGEGRGVVCFDHDQDGDVDILITNVGGSVKLYQNRLNPRAGSGANWLGLRLIGKAPNASALGAVVSVKTGDITQTQAVQLTSSGGAQGPFTLHFGLRNLRVVDELRISWPGEREETVVTEVSTNQMLSVRLR